MAVYKYRKCHFWAEKKEMKSSKPAKLNKAPKVVSLKTSTNAKNGKAKAKPAKKVVVKTVKKGKKVVAKKKATPKK